jgi:hypothetical protein
MFRYKLYFEDGSEARDAAYADNVNVGEVVLIGAGRTLRVLERVPVDEAEGSPFVAPLKVETL